jgi:hypothetical protein
MIFPLDFGTVPTVWYILLISFYFVEFGVFFIFPGMMHNYRCLDLIRHNIGTYLKHKKYMFDIPIPFCHNLYLYATLKQFLTEFAARYNLLYHVYISIPGRIPTCDLIGRLFSCSRRDIGGDEDAVLSFCWYFPNLKKKENKYQTYMSYVSNRYQYDGESGQDTDTKLF